MNPDLVCTYEVIQKNVDGLIQCLTAISQNTSKEHYLEIRAKQNLEGVERAARFIYLNKTGFNGLWRVNSKGEYNVPWGQLKNPKIFEPTNLREISIRLSGMRITNLDYAEAVQDARQGDVVYFDPPYIPLSITASFSQYAMADFGLTQQEQLANTVRDLRSKSIHVILSNSDTELSRKIFGKDLNLYQIEAPRAIAAKASSRGNVKEVLGFSYKIPDHLLSESIQPISFC